MDDKAVQAVRAKRDSSLRVGLRLVRDGQAAGFVSAGNTGAAMATAKMVLGGIPGVDRPALAAVFPTAVGTVAILLDVGANVDCKPHNLEQFAVMGEIYFRSMFGTARPRVGLLSIGEEESKGNELTRETFQLLKQLPLNFAGNVEGRDIYTGKVDVIVADGFVGNVALKTSEGVANLVRADAQRNIESHHHAPGRIPAFTQRIHRFQKALRSHRVRRSAATGGERRMFYYARIVECQCHQERLARGVGVRRAPHQ